jgi:predicted nucleic acid-binding protein
MASLLCRKAIEKHIDRHEQQEVWDLFVGHIAAGLWNLYPLGNVELRAAADVIRECQDSVPLRTLEAIHLSVCRMYQIFPLCTTDQVMLRAAKVLRIGVRTIGE